MKRTGWFNKNAKERDTTDTWERYERGKDYCNGLNLYAQTDKNWRFYQGDQWRGAKLGGVAKVQYNFIRPIVLYKIATVAQNSMSLTYNPNAFEMLKEAGEREFMATAQETCEKLNAHASKLWERNKMDTVMWDCIQEAAVSGDSTLYFYYDEERDEVKMESVNNTNIYFGNENDPEIESQPYILIAFRMTVAKAREEARANGVPEDKIQQITSDNDTEHQAGDAAKQELENGNEDDAGKCIVLLELRKRKNEQGKTTVHYTKSSRNVVIQDWEDTGMTTYPVAHMAWDTRKGCIRGYGEVCFLIDNQIEENKTLARRAVAVMQSAYPKMIYDKDSINNKDELMQTGAAIAVTGGDVNAVNTKIAYLEAANISQDATNLSSELMTVTKDLAGASDAALGNIDPTKASGNAILAVRDASTAPMSRQVAVYKQFVEDIGRIWFDIWATYSTEGKTVLVSAEDETGQEIQAIDRIPYEVLNRLKVNINVDISPANPYNKWAVEQSLENYLNQQYITFEEYVEALPPDSAAPKHRLELILQKRQQIMEEQQTVQQGAAMEDVMMQAQGVQEPPVEEQLVTPDQVQQGGTQMQGNRLESPVSLEMSQEIPEEQPMDEAQALELLWQQYPDLTEEELLELL